MSARRSASVGRPPPPWWSHAPARRLLVLLCVCVLLGGCESVKQLLGGPKPPEAAASAPAGPPAYDLDIAAPDDLKPLLTQHLDLARFRATSESGELTRNELDRLLALAPAQVRALLETEGYFNAQVTAQRLDEATPAHLRIAVQPGPRTTVGSVDITLDGPPAERAAADLAELRKRFPLHPGQPFREATWGEAKTAGLNSLRSLGYAAAQWHETSARVDAPNNRADLRLHANSGPLFRAGDIEVRGLSLQNDGAVRSLAGFGRGAVLTEKLMLDYQERLQKLGLFDRASVAVDPDPTHAEAATVVVRVHEQTLQQATVGVGVSANTGPRASLEHTHRKAFGLDLIAHNKLEYGRDRQAWEGELSTHPGEHFWRNLLAGSIEFLQTGDEKRDSSYIRVGRAQESQAVDRTAYVELENSDLRSGNLDQSAQALSLNYEIVLRRLDSILLPTDGYTVSLQGSLGHAHSNYAESGQFFRAYGRLTGYKPLGTSWYGQARLELGQVFAADDVGLPDTKLFRAGGEDSVRGYAYRSLGPLVNGTLVSGRVLLTSSLEIARPLQKIPSVWWATFVDAGQAADHWQDLRLALGYGVGVRWRSPVGPLRVDVSYGEDVKHWRLDFSVGIAF
jgi:translocation and assembly module TamA